MTKKLQIYPRYERHAELIGIGEKGQEKLFNSKVLVCGSGGLGCPVLLYLTAAGVGKISVADDDQVRLTNLQRQVLYDTQQVGTPKVEAAAEKLRSLNPDVHIEALHIRLNSENISAVIQEHDLIIDCCDNFDTRYLLNEHCFLQRKTMISGATVYFDGQINVFKPGQQPDLACYRCLYPVQPANHEAPACTKSAILGPVPGVIGTMMAVEAIKELLNIGESLAGNLISYSGLTGQLQKMKVNKAVGCKTCSH